ncbi:dihydrofolate reductase family protein [Succinatimonas hippei]|uniref:dihydrofolate reductase family protein n=1 Tax=Succinatimonas hippei TaxID=626938 RepID=UPI0026EFA976|nr:dihydrofolate reductase family protein [Succinatimonas hippei]
MKCRIICHMISSIDGRLKTARWTRPFIKTDISTVYDEAANLYHYDGWIIGRKTMAELDDSISEKESSLTDSQADRLPFIGEFSGKKLGIVFDLKGKLHYKTDTLPSGEHIVAVVSSNVKSEYLDELKNVGVSYIFAKEGYEAIPDVIRDLEKYFAVKNLLLEGGGALNGSFLKAKLINEFSILVYPSVDGMSGIDSIVNYQGDDKNDIPGKGTQLHLLTCEKFSGDVVLLRYAVSYIE